MKKVLHVFSRMNRGGAERQTLNLMYELMSQEKIELHICALSGKKGELDQEIESKGGKIHYISINKKGFFNRFYKLIKENKFDIVHSHVLFVSGVINLISFLLRVPIRISHFRTSDDLKNKHSLLRRVRNFILKIMVELFSTDILYVSKTAKSNLITKKIIKSKHKVVYNGFNEEKSVDFKKRQNNFICVGRFIESKNQIFLINVIKETIKKHPDLQFIFIGNDKTVYGEKFKKLVKKNNLQNSINVIGEVDSPLRYLNENKFFLFPSKLEGLPGSLIEAHLNKCIVVSSDIEPNIEVNRYFKKTSYSLPLVEDYWSDTIEKLLCVNNETTNIKHPFTMEENVKVISQIYNV